jgi:excisionase family DNA binding protein
MTTALLDRPDTVVPSVRDAELATTSSRILSRSLPSEEFRVKLEPTGEVLILPESVRRLLTHLLTEMSHGNAVTLIPMHSEMTTQEAADYLNVSRPYVVKLIETRALPHHKVGTHRRIRFSDLRTYKERIDADGQSARDELARQAQELDMGY